MLILSYIISTHLRAYKPSENFKIFKLYLNLVSFTKCLEIPVFIELIFRLFRYSVQLFLCSSNIATLKFSSEKRKPLSKNPKLNANKRDCFRKNFAILPNIFLREIFQAPQSFHN